MTDDADAGGIPAGKHVFEITFRSRFARGDWWSELSTVEERAYDLPTALRQAADRPLADWYPEENGGQQ